MQSLEWIQALAVENTQKLHSIFQDGARSIRIATWTVLCLLWNCITQKPCNNWNCVDVCRDKSAIISLICLYICTLSQCILDAVFLLSIWWYTPPNDWLYSIPVTDSIQACIQFWNPFSRFCLWNCCVWTYLKPVFSGNLNYSNSKRWFEHWMVAPKWFSHIRF